MTLLKEKSVLVEQNSTTRRKNSSRRREYQMEISIFIVFFLNIVSDYITRVSHAVLKKTNCVLSELVRHAHKA